MKLTAEQKNVVEQLRKGFADGMKCYFLCTLGNQGTINVHADGRLDLLGDVLIDACKMAPEMQPVFKRIGDAMPPKPD
jgi:hypothetical protein